MFVDSVMAHRLVLPRRMGRIFVEGVLSTKPWIVLALFSSSFGLAPISFDGNPLGVYATNTSNLITSEELIDK
jgi:hypothetical protein